MSSRVFALDLSARGGDTGFATVDRDEGAHMPLETSAAARVEAAYRIAFERSPFAMALVGEGGLVQNVNCKWTELTERTRSELIERPLPDLLHPEDRADLTDWISAPDEHNAPAHRLYRIANPTGASALVRVSLKSLSEDKCSSILVTLVPASTTCGPDDQKIFNEIAHRARNLVTIIQVMARNLARRSGTSEEFEAAFSPRLASMMTTVNVFAEGGWSGADLGALVKRQLRRYAPVGGVRLGVVGPTIFLSTLAAQNIGMAIHELAFNAGKFGAWSTPVGRIDVTWRRYHHHSGEERVEFLWRETGGPGAAPPYQSEFGRMVCEEMISYALSAQAAISFGSGTLTWRLDAPCSMIDFAPEQTSTAQR